MVTAGRVFVAVQNNKGMLDSKDFQEAKEREENNRSKAVAELLSTEKTFVSEMTILVDVFVEPLRKWSRELVSETEKAIDEKGEANLNKSKQIVISNEDIQTIFSNIEQLLAFNRSFLVDLEEAMNSGGQSAVVEVFLKAAPFMRMFSVYVNNYDRALLMLSIVQSRPLANAFIRACEHQKCCRYLNLPSFLIQPVQRVPRYRLLLETILKYTAGGDPLLPRLREALGQISDVAAKINRDVHVREAQDKMLQLQAEFGAHDFLEPSRQLIMEGDLVKVSRNGPREHKFLLFNDKLVYGEEKGFVRGMFGGVTSGASKKQYRKNRDFPLGRGLYVVNDVGGAYVSRGSESFLGDSGFIFITPDKSFLVQAPTPALKDSWVQALRKVMGELTVKGDSRAPKIEMDLSDKVRPAKSGKSINSDISVWVVNREGKTVKQGFSLPPASLYASCGVISYSELIPQGTLSPTRGFDEEAGFQFSEWDSMHSTVAESFRNEWQDPYGGDCIEVEVPFKQGEKLGLRLRDLSEGGVLIMGFSIRGCPAQVAGVLVGDRITHIDGSGPITSSIELVSATMGDKRGPGGLKLTLRRGFWHSNKGNEVSHLPPIQPCEAAATLWGNIPDSPVPRRRRSSDAAAIDFQPFSSPPIDCFTMSVDSKMWIGRPASTRNARIPLPIPPRIRPHSDRLPVSSNNTLQEKS